MSGIVVRNIDRRARRHDVHEAQGFQKHPFRFGEGRGGARN